METATIVDKQNSDLIDKPGKQLADYRLSKGLSLDYVASKLFLRIQLLEMLEADDYTKLPQAVFIKGYIRSYANLLGLPSDPLISAFNHFCIEERKTERALWQSRRTPNTQERLVRWVTGLIVVTVIAGMSIWWGQSGHLAQQLTNTFKSNTNSGESLEKTAAANSTLTETSLTQVSKLESLFVPTSNTTEASKLESRGG